MRRLIILGILAFVLGLIVAHFSVPTLAQEKEKGKEKIEAEGKTIRTQDSIEPRKIALSPEDSKLFQSIIDKNNKEIEQARKEAEMANKILEQTQRAGQLEVQNIYIQLREKYKIDLAGWDFNPEKKEWVEKQQAAVPTIEKQVNPSQQSK